MAPPPEYDKEPKAPDKSVTNLSADDSKISYNLVKEQQNNSNHKSFNATANADIENNKHVGALDDGQLRALLDEAIAYKRPKDREGKSSLFKELLEEVEQDEQACEAAARCAGGAGSAGGAASARGARRGGAHGRRALPHSNSLQDLMAAALAAEAPRQRAHAHPPPASVSARAHHGGSLPSGVDTSSMLSEEPTRGGYLATVRCVNPPPLAERRVSASDVNGPPDTDTSRRSKPMFPITYTARATLEIGSSSVCSGRAVTTTTPSNQVDSTIPFSCITTPEVVASCNTTSSTSQSAVAVDPKPLQPLQQLQPGSCCRALTSLTGEPAPRPAPAAAAAPAPHTPQTPAEAPTPTAELQQQSRSVVSSSFNGLPLTRPSYGSTTAATDDCKKSLDENGNAVQGFSSPLSGSSQHKKPRRKKSSKNETVIKSQEIDGYQGNKDLNEVLRFIESNADSARGSKIGRAKHKDDSDDKASKKRSTDRRKDKENKMKRATSMEELSRTKLSDLTDKPVPRTEPVKAERRSWGEDAREPRDTFYLRDDTELTDFQTVTKKRKPKRRPDEPEPNRRARAPEPRPRRESAPPSDRSNDSNDDMDSLHSLTSLPPAPAPAAPQPAHASYADIARTRHNIPDLIESCNFYAEGEPAADPNRRDPPPETQAPGDTDYPALDARTRRRDKTTPRQPRKERPEARAGDCPAPDVVSDRRPAVILLDCASRPRDMDGVTFGFDINEQLVGAARRPRCDLVRDALEGAVAVAAGGAALRYVPPPLAAHDARRAHQLHQLVHYVGAAWEDVVRCGNGKVRYFSE